MSSASEAKLAFAPLRVDYVGATWCTVCKTVGPAVAEVARRYGLPLVQRDIAELPEEEAAGILKVPTVRVFRGEHCLATIVTKHVESLHATLAIVSVGGPSAVVDDF